MALSHLLADASARTVYLLEPLRPLTQWWQGTLLLTAALAIVALVIAIYRRDSVELPRGMAILLLTLRIVALLGLLIFFLNPEKRTQQQLVKNSRAVVAVDTSQSMALDDLDRNGSPQRRIDQVVAEFSRGRLLPELRKAHDVIVYTFDQTSQPIEAATFAKLDDVAGKGENGAAATSTGSFAAAATLIGVAAVGLLLALAFAGVFLSLRRRSAKRDASSWAALASVASLIVAIVTFGVAFLAFHEQGLLAALSGEPAKAPQTTVGEEDQDGEKKPAADPAKIDWTTRLSARGLETRLGDALRWIVNKERGGAISAIAVITDGQQNAGADVGLAIKAAQDAGVEVHTIGLGSATRPANVRMVDVEAPPRVYPGDRFGITAYVQGYGYNRETTVDVRLFSTPGEGDGAGAETFEQELRVGLPAEGDITPVKFDVTPKGRGKQTYRVQVEAPSQDHDPKDNGKTASVQIVERKNQVLLFSGGPAREFLFLRNQLHRDRDTTLHVLLQSAQAGASQEGDQLLYEFPKTPDEMFQYDCIIAFDPDWRALDEKQISLLERWLAEQAGGMITVAGPVNTRLWSSLSTNDPRLNTIRAIYPVVFYSEGSPQIRPGRFESNTAWPLTFTREGLETQFLWLGESSVESERNWSSFGGVYGYFATKEAKPGARVYSRFSDPDTALKSELPIYMAGHFYGAGRVFYQASGEMWRVREIDETHFEEYYTKLIRWASEGRLLRESSRGVLMVDKDRCLLGDQVAVRAFLTDPRHEPLTDEQTPAILVRPDGTREPLPMRKLRDAAREGMYAGHFYAQQEGDYRVELPIPRSEKDEVLSREIRARAPELEIERPERNDALLREIADKTGGQYYVGLEAAINPLASGRGAIWTQFTPQTQTTYLPGAKDKRFELSLMTLLLSVSVGALCLEWLIRRLNKLA